MPMILQGHLHMRMRKMATTTYRLSYVAKLVMGTFQTVTRITRPTAAWVRSSLMSVIPVNVLGIRRLVRQEQAS